MNAYRTPAPFTCPECGAQHNRGWVDGVETYRCLGCGYVGKDNRPRPPEPLTDEQFKKAIHALLEHQLGPLYVNPMFVARLRKVFMSAYGFPSNPFFGGCVGTVFGVELYQTPDIPDGWAYVPPGGDPNVLHGGAADTQYMHQLDPTAEPYTPPPPRLSRYERLRADE